jgi:hypothetical protein
MATTIISKTAAFTIADSDLGAGDDSVTYKCTGSFAVTLPSTGVGAGGEFYIESTDGLQTFNTTGATVSLPAGRELKPYPNGTGESSTVSIVCEATGTYKADGDLNPTDWSEISFRAHSTVNQNVTSGDVIEFEVVDYNNGAGYSNTLDEFVAPQDGTYSFGAGVEVASVPDGSYFQLEIWAGATVAKVTSGQKVDSGGAASILATVYDEMELAEGDKVEIRAVHDAGGTLATVEASNSVYFFGSLVGGIKGAKGDSGIDRAIYVEATNTQSVGTSAYTVQFDTIVKQTNLDFDLTNNKFVAPSAGWYEFESRVTATTLAANARVYSYITRSGGFDSIYFEDWNQRDSAGVGRWGGTISCWLDAGTECTLVVVSSSAFTLRQSINSESFLAIRKVSGTSTGVEHDRYEVAFTAYDGTGYSLASGSTSKIDIDTISYDNGSNFDTTNNRFIAPVTGVYMFNGGVQLGNLNDDEYLHTHLYKNGTTAFASGSRSPISDSGAAGQQTRSIVTGQTKLIAGETVELWAYQNTGVAQTCSTTVNNTFLSGHLVQATAKAECSFSADLGGTDDTTSVTATGFTKIPLDNAVFNYGNSFDTTNNKFVAPEGGRYEFTFGATSSTVGTATSDFIAVLYLDGTTAVAYGSRAASNTVAVGSTGSKLLDLQKDQFVELYLYQTESTSETIKGGAHQTYLTGYRLVTTPTEVPEPYNPVVWEYEVTTAATNIDVPSYLLGGKQYRIEVACKEDATGTDSEINCYVNGDTTSTNYYSQQLEANGASTASARNNTAYIGFVKQDTAFTTGTVSVVNGTLYGNFHCTRLESNVPRIFMYSLSNIVTTFNSITAIRIAGATNGLGVGTRIRILRD